ncbi:MAG: hypothetical protein ABW133_04610 [Polyangiaceae bacterium]
MKVLRRGAVHLAGGSTLVLLGTADLGCAAPIEDGATATREEANQAAVDQGYLDFNYQPGTPLNLGFVPYSSPDEFIRTGEQLDIRVAISTLWYRLHPSEPFPSEITRAQSLRAEYRVIFQNKGVTVRELRLASGAWTGSDVWSLSATTPSFLVPSTGVDEIAFEVTISDAADEGHTVNFAADDFPSVQVFGAELPLKHLLFDSLGTSLRNRIIERGDLFRNNVFALSYTDWRANTLIDSASVDREIGRAIGFGRFGQYEMPIYGEIVYEISCGVGRDGNFAGEQPLVANTNSRVLPYGQGRTAYEANIYAYGNAVNLYFHVRPYLYADYSKYTNVTSKRYSDYQRIFLQDRERWDNENGQAFDNYDFNLADSP